MTWEEKIRANLKQVVRTLLERVHGDWLTDEELDDTCEDLIPVLRAALQKVGLTDMITGSTVNPRYLPSADDRGHPLPAGFVDGIELSTVKAGDVLVVSMPANRLCVMTRPQVSGPAEAGE